MNNSNDPFQAFKSFIFSIFGDKATEQSEKVDNPKTEKVDNLQVKINNNYEPENRQLRPITPDLSAEINTKLPDDVLRVVFGQLGFNDLDSVSKVSHYWNQLTLGLFSYKEFFAVETFGSILSEKIPDKYPEIKLELLEATNIDNVTKTGTVIKNDTVVQNNAHPIKNKEKFIQNMDEFIQSMFKITEGNDLVSQRNMLLKARFNVVEILSKLENEDRLKLERSCVLIKKPTLFDPIFELARLHAKFVGLTLDYRDKFTAARIAYDFCELEAVDMALICLKIIGLQGRYNEDYYFAVKFVANHLLESGNFQKVGELVKITIDPTDNKGASMMREIVECCIPLGKMDEGYALAQQLSVSDLRKLNALNPIVQKINEKKFTHALLLRNKLDQDLWKESTELITKGFEQNCCKRIQEGKFDEVKKLVDNPGLMRKDIVENVCVALAIGLIKVDRFDEGIECAKLLDVNQPQVDDKLAQIIAALCEKDQFDKTDKIIDIKTNNYSHVRSRMVSHYQSISQAKFDDAIHKIKNNSSYTFTITYLIKKLLDAGKIDQSIDMLFMISDLKLRDEALKMFTEKS